MVFSPWCYFSGNLLWLMRCVSSASCPFTHPIPLFLLLFLPASQFNRTFWQRLHSLCMLENLNEFYSLSTRSLPMPSVPKPPSQHAGTRWLISGLHHSLGDALDETLSLVQSRLAAPSVCRPDTCPSSWGAPPLEGPDLAAPLFPGNPVSLFLHLSCWSLLRQDLWEVNFLKLFTSINIFILPSDLIGSLNIEVTFSQK